MILSPVTEVPSDSSVVGHLTRLLAPLTSVLGGRRGVGDFTAQVWLDRVLGWPSEDRGRADDMRDYTVTTRIRGSRQACYDTAQDLELRRRTDEGLLAAILGDHAMGMAQWRADAWRNSRYDVWRSPQTAIVWERPPNIFIERMPLSIFGSFEHRHVFNEEASETEMIDTVKFYVPDVPDVPDELGGSAMPGIYVSEYLGRLLWRRGGAIKRVVEGDVWWEKFR